MLTPECTDIQYLHTHRERVKSNLLAMLFHRNKLCRMRKPLMCCGCKTTLLHKDLKLVKASAITRCKDQRKWDREGLRMFFCSSFSINARLINKTRYQSASLPPLSSVREQLQYSAALKVTARDKMFHITHSVFFFCGSTCFSPARGYCNCALSHRVSNHQLLCAHHVTM